MTKKKKEEQKILVEERVDVDTKRLYGSLDDAILYMTEIRDQYRGVDITLDEHWTGYEDMEMTFVYQREETDTEFACRLRQIEADRRYAAEKKRLADQREKDLEELARLKSKLGIWH